MNEWQAFVAENETVLAHTRVRQARIPGAMPLSISKDRSIRELLEILQQSPKAGQLYVVNDNREFVGTVRLCELLEYAFPYASAYEDGQELIGIIPKNEAGAYVAGQVADTAAPCANDDQLLDDIVQPFLFHDGCELPVVNAARQIIGVITVQDLMKACFETRETTKKRTMPPAAAG